MSSPAERADYVRKCIPSYGLFTEHQWRISTGAFDLGREVAKELESLGRILLQFYRAANLLYRHSVEGRRPPWVARWLDQGKPEKLVGFQRDPAFKNELPRVIRPDLLITDEGLKITELDSVPGGIGLTAWLNLVYDELGYPVLGGARGMLDGFKSIFGPTSKVHLLVSEEAATYRPEMEWVAEQLGPAFAVRDQQFRAFSDGDAVYRFFELFDMPNIAGAAAFVELAKSGRIHLTPPLKPIFEEKMLFALLCNRNLAEFWRQELGHGFLRRMMSLTPYTWLIDPSPIPPHAAIPELGITDWSQLAGFSQKQRDLILKVSGFSPQAWGARGVYLGSDLSHADWAIALQKASSSFETSPFILQRYHKPSLVRAEWFDFDRNESVSMEGRARLCPYYFVSGDGDSARARLGGVLATICPADKKIIHGMTDAVFAPCTA